jgi:hypothetical protein
MVGHLSSRDSIFFFFYFFSLEPEDIKGISLGVIWNFGGVTGLP